MLAVILWIFKNPILETNWYDESLEILEILELRFIVEKS